MVVVRAVPLDVTAYERIRTETLFLHDRGLLRVGGAKPPDRRFMAPTITLLNNKTTKRETHEKNDPPFRLGCPQEFHRCGLAAERRTKQQSRARKRAISPL